MTKTTTPVTNKKKPVQPTCPQCKVRFRTVASKARKYCSDECRVASVNAKKRTTSKKRASANPFFYYLASEVSRAGTLQILEGHTKESLLQLVALYKAHQRYNGYGERKEIGLTPYEMSHILPVKKHPTHIGLLRADNLVIAPQAMNRAHGTNHYGHGVGIPKSSLLPQYRISKEAARSTVVQKIISYLGAALVDEVVREAGLKPSKRHQLTEWLLANLIPTNKEHKAHLKALDDMTTIAMSKLKATLQGKLEAEEEEGVLEFKLLCAYSDTSVLLLEWERLSTFRPDIAHPLEHLSLIQRMFGFRAKFDSDNAQLVFDLLHGKEVHHVLPAVESQCSLGRLSGHKVHSYVVATATAPATILQLPTKAPQRASSTFDNFADECDWEAELNAPQTITEPHTTACVHDDDEGCLLDDPFEFECVYQIAA